MARKDFDVELLKACFDYNPESGLLTWKISSGQSSKGSTAGRIGMAGYLKLCLHGRHYVAHRVAWAIHYGSQPPEIIDHINQDKTDNRISNLRDGTCAVNQQNQQRPHSRNKTSQYLGVSRFNGYWRAKIYHKGKYIFLGYFDSEIAASEAYIVAKRKIHQGCCI